MTDRVWVLHNAVTADAGPDAHDVLTQVEEVSAALTSLGLEPDPLAISLDLEAARGTLRGSPAAFAFNLVEDIGGHAELIAGVPMLLDALGVPYTGAPADAIFLTSNKPLAKRWLERHGLPTPAWLDGEPDASAPHGINRADGQDRAAHAAARSRRAHLVRGPAASPEGEPPRESERWIVKPVWEDASVGLNDASVVANAAAARARLAECRERGGAWFAERYVDGREINIALLADGADVQVLPVAEIRFVGFPADKPRIVGYDAKWREDSFEYRNTPRDFALARAEPELHARLVALVRECWQVFGLRGYARVDLRVDERGDPWVLEINANPCLSSDAGFAAALAEAGIPFRDAVARIVRAVPGLTLSL